MMIIMPGIFKKTGSMFMSGLLNTGSDELSEDMGRWQ